MKRLLVCAGVLLAGVTAFGQKKPPASPPEKATATIAGKQIAIVYSSPRVRGREGHIFGKGGLISHDQDYPYWRAGANSATELRTEAPLTIGGLNVPAGDYTMFVDIADPAQWTLVISKETGETGLNYDKTKDLGRVKMHMAKPPAMVEDLKYTIAPQGGGRATLTLAWEDVSASVPIRVQ